MSISSRIRRVSEFGIWLAAGVLLISCPKHAAGQSTFGAVVGAVTDSQSAVITSAAIKLTEVQTMSRERHRQQRLARTSL